MSLTHTPIPAGRRAVDRHGDRPESSAPRLRLVHGGDATAPAGMATGPAGVSEAERQEARRREARRLHPSAGHRLAPVGGRPSRPGGDAAGAAAVTQGAIAPAVRGTAIAPGGRVAAIAPGGRGTAMSPGGRPATGADPVPMRLTRRGRVVVRIGSALLAALAVVSGVLLIGRTAEAGSTSTSIPSTYRVVLPGETLWQIAGEVDPVADRRDTVARIIEMNALSSAQVYAGQRVAVPVGP